MEFTSAVFSPILSALIGAGLINALLSLAVLLAMSNESNLYYFISIIVVSMMLNGFGVGLMRISCMGTDPFSSMNYSFSVFFHIPLGSVVILVSCLLLGLSLFTMRSSLGFGTVIMAFGTGPLLAFFKEHIAQPFVQKVCEK